MMLNINNNENIETVPRTLFSSEKRLNTNVYQVTMYQENCILQVTTSISFVKKFDKNHIPLSLNQMEELLEKDPEAKIFDENNIPLSLKQIPG